MALYLFQGAYTAEAMAKLIKKPQDRFGVIAKALKKFGGKLHGGWFSFGEYDVVLVMELPDNVTAAAFAVAAEAGGALRAGRTTPLLSAREMGQMLRKAKSSSYRPPQ
jgi:uncharacterized protein with GYD domain